MAGKEGLLMEKGQTKILQSNEQLKEKKIRRLHVTLKVELHVKRTETGRKKIIQGNKC